MIREEKIFVAGTYNDMSGNKVTIDANTLSDIANDYKEFAKKDPAPIQIGHPKHDSPAVGRILNLRADGNNLFAIAEFNDDDVPKLKNKYLRKSAEFYPPHSTANPKKGKIFFKGLGLVNNPAVPNLGAINFSDDGEIYTFDSEELCFSEDSNNILSSIISQLKEFKEYFKKEKEILKKPINNQLNFSEQPMDQDIKIKELEAALLAQKNKSEKQEQALLNFSSMHQDNLIKNKVTELVSNNKLDKSLHDETLNFAMGLKSDSIDFSETDSKALQFLSIIEKIQRPVVKINVPTGEQDYSNAVNFSEGEDIAAIMLKDTKALIASGMDVDEAYMQARSKFEK